MIQQRCQGQQRGLSPGVELVILLPALLILIGVTVAGGRLWLTRSTIDQAAYSAARAASIERDGAQAAAQGRAAAVAELHTDGVHCAQRSITLDTAGFHSAIGTPSAVHAILRCRVQLGDAAVPGLPGSMMLTGRASVPIDSYRERR